MLSVEGNGSAQSTSPDGIQALFFQKTWNVTSPAVFEFAKRALEMSEVSSGSNQSPFVLIPKEDKPSSIKGFRPISLCNVCIKLATKMFVNRLKGV